MADGFISLIIPTVLINVVRAHRQVRERAGASNQHNTGQPRTHCFLPCGGVGWGVPAAMPVRRAEQGTGRAKVSPRPWEWVKTHEIGCCYPVGEHRERFKSHLTKA